MTHDPTVDESLAPGAASGHGADPQLDRINLEQALRDFEVANRRVLDLAHRLASMHAELLQTRTELSLTKIELQDAQRFLNRIRQSRLFPLVRALAQTRRMAKR